MNHKKPIHWKDLLPLVPFSLGVVTNEISEDLERALDIAVELGITTIELNSLWGKQVSDLTAEEATRARELIHRRHLRVGQITGAAFKSLSLDDLPATAYDDHPGYRKHLEILKQSIELARFFGTDRVRIFTFRRSEIHGLGNPSPRRSTGGPLDTARIERITLGLRPLCGLAEAAGVTLCIENVRSCYGDSGYNSARILEAVGAPSLQLTWDPANAYVSGETAVPDGYQVVRPYIVNVHLKDARVVDEASGLTVWERIGSGEVGIREQLFLLLRDGYSGIVNLETHWRLPGDQGEESTRETYEGFLSKLALALEDAS